MKATTAIGALSLALTCISTASEGAVVAPAVGAHRSFSRSSMSSRTVHGMTTNRSFNTSINSTFNNGSVGISQSRAIRGVPSNESFNLVGAFSPFSANGPAASRTVNGTVTSSFNSPSGDGSSTESFSHTFPATGNNFPTSQSVINQPLSGVGFSTPGPFSGGVGVGSDFQPGFSEGVGVGSDFQPGLSGDGGGDEGGGPPETAEGTVLNGQASAIAAAGQYNRDTAAAAVKATQADSQAMKNDVDRIRTFYAMREAGRIGRENERGPRPDAEELARRAHVGVPRALTTNQIDPVNGDLHWPGFFQDPRFERARMEINDNAVNWVRYGELSFYDRSRMRENVSKLFEELNSQIDALPPQEYTACRSFLGSLLYATTHSML